MTQASMDEEIARLKSLILQLCSQRNQRSPIFRLPNEILSSIFLHYARDYHADGRGPAWINVSHVCSHWRDVALGFSALWGHISFRRVSWTDELLVRSKNAPLYIHVSPRSLYYPGLLRNVMAHTNRIQELKMDLPDTDFLPMLSSRAPQLQTLSIRISDPSDSEEPFVLFKEDTPALRVLCLIDCPVSLNSFKLNSLVTLHLDSDEPLQHNAEEFLGILRYMPHLETICFAQEIPGSQEFVSSTAFHNFQKVDLPRLSCFRVDSQLSAVVALVSCTSIPINAELDLECFYENNADDIALLSSVLRHRYSASKASLAIRSLAIASRGERERRVTFYSSEFNGDSLPFGPGAEKNRGFPLQVTLTRLNPEFDGAVDRIHSDMCFFMPLARVLAVYSYNPPLSSDFWERLLEHIPDVRTIKLVSGEVPELASLLGFDPITTEKNEGVAHRMLAPSLERLELYGMVQDEGLVDALTPLRDALLTRPGPEVPLVTKSWEEVEDDADEEVSGAMTTDDDSDETLSDGFSYTSI